jgi:hypothetical protein
LFCRVAVLSPFPLRRTSKCIIKSRKQGSFRLLCWFSSFPLVFVTVFAGRKEIEYADCKNNVPKATLSLREPTKQLQYVTVRSGLFWFRSKSRTGRTSVLLLHRVYLLPACLLQVDGATSGRTDFQKEQTFRKNRLSKRTDFQEEHENKRTAPLRLAAAYAPPVAGRGGQSRLRCGKNILSFRLSAAAWLTLRIERSGASHRQPAPLRLSLFSALLVHLFSQRLFRFRDIAEMLSSFRYVFAPWSKVPILFISGFGFGRGKYVGWCTRKRTLRRLSPCRLPASGRLVRPPQRTHGGHPP